MNPDSPDAENPAAPVPRRRAADIIDTLYEDLRRLAAKKMANEAPG